MLPSKTSISAIALLSALALAGCNPARNTTATSSSSADLAALAMPLTTGPETPVAPAPSAAALPRASAPVRVVRVRRPEDDYAYVDHAYAMSDAFGDAPPDYGYDYGPTHLWAWRGRDDSVRLVEPLDGGDRYYYYRAGARAPYLVRDYDNSYGYDDNGDLVVVYDRGGRPVRDTERYADRAARELTRARAVYAASLNSERREVRATNWAARRSQIDAARADWSAQAARESEWRAYHDAHAAEQAAYWQGERDQRARQAQAFNDWQRQDYRGSPPAAIGDRQQQALADQLPRDHAVTQARLNQQLADRQTQQQARQQAEFRNNQQRAEADKQRQSAEQRTQQQLAAQQASLQAHQQAEARLAAVKQQKQAEAEEARRKQLGAQQASLQAHQQAEARLAALKQQKQAEAAEARRKQIGAQQAAQQASQQAHQQAEARLAAVKQQKLAEAEEARRKQIGAQKAAQQAHQQAEARQRQQLAQQQQAHEHQQQAQQQKVLAAQQLAHQQAVARQQAAAQQKAKAAHHDDPHPDKPGERRGNPHDQRQ